MTDNNRESSDNTSMERKGEGQHNENGLGESRFETIYKLIDAMIEKIDMPHNRTRAIKYGVRAIGELFDNEEGKGGHSRSESAEEGSASEDRGRSTGRSSGSQHEGTSPRRG
jgi:hypothetical protein